MPVRGASSWVEIVLRHRDLARTDLECRELGTQPSQGWQGRALESIYPILYLGALHLKMCLDVTCSL